MVSIIITVIFAIAVAYFSSQNTRSVTIQLGSYQLNGVPIYLIVLVSVLVGLLFAAIIHIIRSLSTAMKIGDLEEDLTKEKEKNLQLAKVNHELELENVRLQPTEIETVHERNSL